MSDQENGKIKYRSTMARLRWRNLYIKCEVVNPSHKASQRWLAAAASELFDVAEVTFKTGGTLMAKTDFEKGKPDELVTLELTRDAVLGIKHAVKEIIQGTRERPPASQLERRELFESCQGIGPDGIFARIVEKEAKLPDSEDLEEGSELNEMDKKPEKPA